jgi:hypothetical protein
MNASFFKNKFHLKALVLIIIKKNNNKTCKVKPNDPLSRSTITVRRSLSDEANVAPESRKEDLVIEDMLSLSLVIN